MSRLTVTKLAPSLGAEIQGIDLRKPIADDTFQELLDAWHEHLVLRFRGQGLSDPELLAFSRRFGELDPPGPNAQGKPYIAEFPEINVISNVKKDGIAIGGLGDGEATWHCDMTYVERPPRAAALHALELPPGGGDTFWSNQYAAFERMPEDLKRAIEGRVAVHDATYNSAGIMRRGYQEVTDPREAPGARHPLVVVHPATKRPVLFLGRRRNSYIVGLELAESEALLDRLWAHASRPEFTFRQVWQQHDLILWDNRATLHRRDSFDAQTRRVMHRTQIKGPEIVGYAA